MNELELPYASFFQRALARFIDLWVVLLPLFIFYLIDRALGSPFRNLSVFHWQNPDSATMFLSTDLPGPLIILLLIKLFVAYPYFALLESSHWQGTLGKLALRIKVTDLTGNRISFARATGRYFCKIISSVEFMVGYIISFSDQRQTIHDYLSGTLVVRKRVVFSAYYAMPRVSSPFMFDVPLPWKHRDKSSAEPAGFECFWCDYQGTKKQATCPRCQRVGFLSVHGTRGILLMAGSTFTLLGGALVYLIFWVVSERLMDDKLERPGTPWPIIFIIGLACVLCLGGGLSSLLQKKWFVRVLILLSAGRFGPIRKAP